VKLWNPKTLELVATLAGHRGAINCLVFSPDGRSLITCGDEGAMKIWNVAAREELFDIYQHHDRGLVEVSVSPDGRWLAATTHSYGRMLLFDLGEQPK
jgi:WD40 repeat protein